jgi:Flp pilus assembly protein TadB
MAQTKRKRRRKHRGTPAGNVQRQARSGQARNRQDSKAIARERRQARLDREPTWRGAINRAAIAAVLFGVLMVLLFQRAVVQAVVYTLFVFLLYIPLGYGTDKLLYNFRQRRKARG